MTDLHRTFVSYIRSVFFIPLFILTLVGFDVCMRIVRPFSFRGFLRLQYWMCRTIRGLLAIIGGVRFILRVPTDYSDTLPLLVISNHQSMYDVSLLTELFDRHQPRFISKKELAQWVPAVSFIARNNKTALIDRNNRSQAIAEIEKVTRITAEDNGALIIFPEGTRARDGLMKSFKRAGITSILSSMPKALIIPVAISGSWKILRYGLFPIPANVEVTVTALEPIQWENNTSASEDFIKGIEQSIQQQQFADSQKEKM